MQEFPIWVFITFLVLLFGAIILEGALRRAEGQFKEALRSLAGGFELLPGTYLAEAEESLAYFEVLMNPRRYAELPPVVRAELLP